MFKTTVRISGTLLALTIALLLPLHAWATSYHTIAIDGINDFASDESVPGTSGSTWYFTWDSTTFYFGINATDVGSGSSTEWVHLYLDTDPQAIPLSGNGTSTGVLYNTQQPTLPFNADFHFRWKTDNSYTNLLYWNAGTSSWNDTGSSGIAAYQNGTYVEFSIQRSSLGNPAALYVAGAMVNEASGAEWTFFMAPNTNTEGYDVDYTNYFGFVLDAGIAPNSTDNRDCHPAITVTSNADAGAGTLRRAIAQTCVGGDIAFSGNTSIYLATELAIAKRLTINGGSYTVRLSGDTGNDGTPDVRVLDISASGVVTLSHLSIISGTTTDDGGGICNYGTLMVQGCTFIGNSADIGSYGLGGGIFNQGTLIVQDSAFIGNSAYNGGGIDNNSLGTLTVINTTLSDNSSPYGGGILNSHILTMTNTTLSGNYSTSSPSFGAGIYTSSGGTSYFRNNIIANSSGASDCSNSGTIVDNVNNLVEDNTCSPAFSGDPSLDTLALNGGRTLTHALLPNSPAIDAGDPAYCPATDQRSRARADLRCDIGAFELRYLDSDTVIKSGFTGGSSYSFGPTWVSMTLAANNTGSLAVTKRLIYPGGSFDPGEMQATWWITSNLTTPFVATLAFCYVDLEVVGLNENTLQAYRWNGAQWLPYTSTPDPANNCVTVENVSAFSAWTLAGPGAPNALTLRTLAADGNPWAWPLLVIFGVSLFRQARRKHRT